jgi:hypothetical protein
MWMSLSSGHCDSAIQSSHHVLLLVLTNRLLNGRLCDLHVGHLHHLSTRHLLVHQPKVDLQGTGNPVHVLELDILAFALLGQVMAKACTLLVANSVVILCNARGKRGSA